MIFFFRILIITSFHSRLSHCDSTPSILNFFVSSQIISGFVLVQTILLRIYEMKYENQQSRILKFLRDSSSSVGKFIPSSWTNNVDGEKCDDCKIASNMIDKISMMSVFALYILLYVAYFPRPTPAKMDDLEVLPTM